MTYFTFKSAGSNAALPKMYVMNAIRGCFNFKKLLLC